ncbi:MAG TPA: MFS transporter [Pseudomonadales bacterium]|nr:MFS transporter [Pseudomonadales bacterium]
MVARPEPESAEEPVRSALSPFQYPIFRNVWLASTVSNLGGLIQSVGASWMMISLSQPADMVALVQASVTLPTMLFSLLAGAMADSFDRRKILLSAQCFMLLMSITLSVFAWSGLLSPWLLLFFTFSIGCGSAMNAPAWQASVGDMVPRAELPGAVSLNSMSFNMARSVGPAIGGAIVATAGAAAAFTINAFSYTAMIGVLARWKREKPAQVLPPETLGMAIQAGVRYVAMSPALHAVMGRAALFGIGASAVTALMPLVAKHLVAGGPLTYGLLLGAFGVGAVGGALVTARLRQLWSTEAIVRLAAGSFAVAAFTVAMSTYLAVTMLALCVAGAGWVLALSTFNVAVQMSTPRWVVARALSLYQMAAFGGLAGGAWMWGVIAEAHGVQTSLTIASFVTLGSALIGLWWRLSQAEELNLDPLRQWRAPETAVPVEARTGPIVVTVEYTIRQEDVLEFLAAMAERRRIRRRDGALAWTLLRDLADPQIWVERYETATWLDYIRHNNRLTQEDAVIPERIRALHRGTEGPRVRRMIERQTAGLPAGRDPGARELAQPLTDPTPSS